MANNNSDISQQSPSSNPALHGPLIRPPLTIRTPAGPRPFHTTIATTANLTNLLPTGTVLAFQALIPSFSNNGLCHVTHKYLTGCLIWFLAFLCFLSSFTDTFLGPTGKLYYGIATRKGLYVFSEVSWDEEKKEGSSNNNKGGHGQDLAKYRVRVIDFVHAFVSLVVFFVFALGHPRVLRCYAGDSAVNLDKMLVNVPLVVGAFSSFLFMLFPTSRRGIGYADISAQA